MPSISPTASLSDEGFIANHSDVSADVNFSDREHVEDIATDNRLEDSSSSSNGHTVDSYIQIKQNGFHQNGEVSKVDSLATYRDIEITEPNEDKVNSCPEDDSELFRPSKEVNAEFWLPPEPEVEEDDVYGSIANYEDDDDDDGGTWAKPSSLSNFGDEENGNHKFKEEKIKTMGDVRNGKFMALVSQLIKSVGVDCGNDGENWVDIVTSLSWEAATFLKPDAEEGKAMDPDGYVKIKCVLTGSRSQSQLIKGLVFKKHAAHKHMPIKYDHPKLLLINGSLDLSSGGLSSFGSMQQETENVKSIVDTIEMCHPNVVLVEKSVPRGIQEAILAKGMTLIFDMKLHRLERVARCIGLPISSSEIAAGQRLRQCDSFHIEKFVEEHAVPAEGGKKQSKTLMFLEGAPSRLGCTILLMGANSNELKRIKCVVRCAVVMAYHLMLETSFLLDQGAMFSTISPSEVVDLALSSKKLTPVGTDEVAISFLEESDSETNSKPRFEIPICNEDLISPSFKQYNAATFPGFSLSTSIQEVINDSFPLFSDSPESESDRINEDSVAENIVEISSETGDNFEDESRSKSEEENLVIDAQAHLAESSDNTQNQSDSGEEEICCKDKIQSVLESESILVLMSSRNASRGTICEQRHFSQIKFYRSFDVPLGKFLRDNLLNQRLQCKTCSEPPEAHLFYYAHHNKQLTIQVRRLPAVKSLPGETEGKLWMWSRCGKCTIHGDGSSKSTKRVLISTAAAGLSFGKFLELSFSNQSSFKCLSSCGHSFDKDFLYFFGLGPMVAMFKYSLVATYSVSLPAQEMEFNSSVRGDFLKNEFENVHLKGESVFLDIERSLKDLETRYVGVILNIQGSRKEFADIVEILKQEKSQFQADIQNAIKNGSERNALSNLLRLNRVRLELLLESCLWDHRLHALLSSAFTMIDTDSVDLQSQDPQELEENETAPDESSATDISTKNCNSADSTFESVSEEVPTDEQIDDLQSIPIENREDYSIAPEGNSQQDTSDVSVDSQTGRTIPIAKDAEGSTSGSNHSQSVRMLSVLSDRENDNSWMWAPFADILCVYMDDLQKGYVPKFESFGSYTAESTARKLITDEGSRLHIPLGTIDYIVSDYEDEFSSIIACTLALLNYEVTEDILAEDIRREKGLTHAFSLPSPHMSTFGSFDSDGVHSPPAHTLEDSHSSSFDSLDLLELVSYGASHPKISMGSGKYSGKRKYSVVCFFAADFRQLRNRCCPSEVDYIASLSRCKNWDAKGGKSKSFFAKTLDDRLIIKEIKRTEFESFMTFAPNYFEYMNQCYELGNQTCLAKILGIYQIAIRATKNGKETRHDLLVMENLSFGRNISRQYDLKGALHARLTAGGNESGDVLLDQNFVNDMNVSPLYVSRKSKRNLQRAVYNDTNFLNSINVMDYSLLVGVDIQRRELICGIIDYLRQYTWDKQLENWVKSSLVVPKNTLPTIISPKEYKKRFRKFIDTHFLSVPDHWCSQRSSNPCKLCGPSDGNGSSHRSHKSE